MIGYESKVKKQTTETLIDINRMDLQVFMGFGFLAFMPGQWVWETPLCSGVDLSHESQMQLYHILLFESKLPLRRFLRHFLMGFRREQLRRHQIYLNPKLWD